MPYPSDLTDEQWDLLEPLLCRPGKPGRKHADLRTVVDGILYITRTGCQWRYLPESFGAWTRVWSQFRRWSPGGTWVVAALHEQVRLAAGRAEQPTMIVIGTSLARGASQGGATLPQPRRPVWRGPGRQTRGRGRCDGHAGRGVGGAGLHDGVPRHRAATRAHGTPRGHEQARAGAGGPWHIVEGSMHLVGEVRAGGSAGVLAGPPIGVPADHARLAGRGRARAARTQPLAGQIVARTPPAQRLGAAGRVLRSAMPRTHNVMIDCKDDSGPMLQIRCAEPSRVMRRESRR